ncbi:MAG: carboxylating nicotinate-nucleotide diphosphorylase [Planctomycetes bacterium]|nr:carboxylating nicotinate-nucleotide diphosphorylase [Planctomycetota bacterium]
MSEIENRGRALAAEPAVENLLRAALAEDIGAGDVTTRTMVPEEARAEARILVREDGVVGGFPIVERLLELAGGEVRFVERLPEGSRVRGDQEVARLEGSARALLTLERSILNFLQRIGGVASTTARFVALVVGTRARILETRKTIPGWRRLDKYAVLVGGGDNHRLGLFDQILAKENHFALCPGADFAARVAWLMNHRPAGVAVEVEVENLDEFRAALGAGVEMILLDDMSLDDMATAVHERDASGRSALLEASGGISAANLRAVAETGVDRISIGALTHSVKALDLSMLIDLGHSGTPAAQQA